MAVNYQPKGFNNVIPYLTVDDPGKLLDFIVKVLKGKVRDKMEHDGKIAHAEVVIGDSMIMLGQAGGPFVPTPAAMYVYVPDVDATFKAALKAGATEVKKMEDQFYGDRSGAVKDSNGNTWYLATHVEDVSPKEMQKRMAKMGQQK
jgi:uncharacterized glyoxalase superfamily protein PhnB